jgi:hypothetical protein
VNRGPDDAHDPDPIADPFEAIVAVWRREGAVPSWPADDRPPAEEPPQTPPAPVPPVRPVSFAAAAAEPDVDRPEHFVPPEPPPLPRIGPPALVGFAMLVLGLTLVTVPGLVGVSDVYGLPLGLLALAAGLGWLVLRLWPSTPARGDGDGEDDGAVL